MRLLPWLKQASHWSTHDYHAQAWTSSIHLLWTRLSLERGLVYDRLPCAYAQATGLQLARRRTARGGSGAQRQASLHYNNCFLGRPMANTCSPNGLHRARGLHWVKKWCEHAGEVSLRHTIRANMHTRPFACSASATNATNHNRGNGPRIGTPLARARALRCTAMRSPSPRAHTREKSASPKSMPALR